MSMECYCEPMDADGGGCEVWNLTWRKARVQHRCCECKEPILQGERYERIFSVFEDEINVSTTCEFCANEYQRLLAKHPDLSWLKGELACIVVWDMRNEARAPT